MISFRLLFGIERQTPRLEYPAVNRPDAAAVSPRAGSRALFSPGLIDLPAEKRAVKIRMLGINGAQFLDSHLADVAVLGEPRKGRNSGLNLESGNLLVLRSQLLLRRRGCVPSAEQSANSDSSTQLHIVLQFTNEERTGRATRRFRVIPSGNVAFGIPRRFLAQPRGAVGRRSTARL